jgi:prevent-host-death family protein
MMRALELHDSRLMAISDAGGRTDIMLRGYVHQWERHHDVWKGTGWMQQVRLDRESTCGYTVLMASRSRKVRNQFPVREAKNRFSELVRRVAEGEEIIITSHGEARARLCPIRRGARRFEVDWKWLRGMRVADTQSPAETSIRAERDARD